METKLLLDTLGRFHTEHRGMVEVKGKGMLDTYWLMGKEGGIARDDHDEDAESGALEAGDTPGLATNAILSALLFCKKCAMFGTHGTHFFNDPRFLKAYRTGMS